MTDEVQEGNEDVSEDVVETSQAPAMSAVEQEARDSGWVPESEYTGDKNKWVDAAEFVRRGPLFEKINSQSREIKAMRQAIADIQQLHSRSREVEYKKALATLRAEKKAALDDGDSDGVIEVDEKMDMLREAQREDARRPAQPQSNGEDHPEFQNWVAKNNWYVSNRGMKAFADATGVELRERGLSPSEVLREVEKKVRSEFPQRFTNPNQTKPNAVEGGNASGTSGGKDNFVLSSQERDVMRNFVRSGVMTEKEYIAELKKTREV